MIVVAGKGCASLLRGSGDNHAIPFCPFRGCSGPGWPRARARVEPEASAAVGEFRRSPHHHRQVGIDPRCPFGSGRKRPPDIPAADSLCVIFSSISGRDQGDALRKAVGLTYPTSISPHIGHVGRTLGLFCPPLPAPGLERTSSSTSGPIEAAVLVRHAPVAGRILLVRHTVLCPIPSTETRGCHPIHTKIPRPVQGPV